MESTSGRSSRSSLMHTKRSFMSRAVSSSSKDSRSITWHQWQAEYPIDSRIGRSSARARSERLLAPRVPVHGVVLVLEEVGRGLACEPVGHVFEATRPAASHSGDPISGCRERKFEGGKPGRAPQLPGRQAGTSGSARRSSGGALQLSPTSSELGSLDLPARASSAATRRTPRSAGTCRARSPSGRGPGARGPARRPDSCPSRSTTTARTTWPRTSSGAATAAASATAGWEISADSTSNGPIRYPAEMITSSVRPSNQR